MSEDLAKLLVKKYAEKHGISEEEAMQRYLPLFKENDETLKRLEREASKLAMATEIFGKLGEARDKMPDPAQAALGAMATATVAKTVLGDEDEGDLMKGLMDEVKKVQKVYLAMRFIDRLLGGSDEEVVKQLLGKLEALEQKIAGIEEKKKSEEVAKLEEMIKELHEKLEAMAAMVTSQPQPDNNVEEKKPKSLDDLLKEYMSITEEAKGWLERIGYRVEPDKLGKDEVERLLEEHKKKLLEELRSKPDELKAWLEEHGYKIQVPPRSWDDVERMVKEAEKRGYEMALDDKRIDAVQRVIERAVDNITNMFAPAIRQYWESVMSSRMGAQSAQSAAEAAGGGAVSAAGNVRRGLQAASGSSS
jgi:L-rhamnose mutarotase